MPLPDELNTEQEDDIVGLWSWDGKKVFSLI
jgi:hypothetical protein